MKILQQKVAAYKIPMEGRQKMSMEEVRAAYIAFLEKTVDEMAQNK